MNRIRNPYDMIEIDGKRYLAIPARHGCSGCAFLDRERERKYGLCPCRQDYMDVSCILAACNCIFVEVTEKTEEKTQENTHE